MADGGIGEMSLADMALSGAAVGGVGAALTGKNPLTGALLGGALGGIGGLAGQGAAVGTGMGSGADLSAFYDAGAAPAIAPVADAATQSSVLNAIGANPGYQLTGSDAASLYGNAGYGSSTPYAMNSSDAASLYGNAGYGGDVAATSVGGGAAQQAATSFDSFGNPVAAGSPSAMSADPTGQAAAYQAGASNPNVDTTGIGNFLQNNYGKIGAGLAAAYLLGPGSKPNLLPGYTPPSASSYGLGRTLAAGYQPARPMAGGGITSLNVGPGSVPTQGVAPSDLMQKPNQGAGLDSLAAQYGISPQMVSQARQTYGFSAGGPTEMAVGGKLLSGHGDGMSDSIKANISGNQEARLADSEFVVPADVVSHLGNGSTDAGAKQLYSMMDRVRKARTGRKAQGRQINPQQYMPA